MNKLERPNSLTKSRAFLTKDHTSLEIYNPNFILNLVVFLRWVYLKILATARIINIEENSESSGKTFLSQSMKRSRRHLGILYAGIEFKFKITFYASIWGLSCSCCMNRPTYLCSVCKLSYWWRTKKASGTYEKNTTYADIVRSMPHNVPELNGSCKNENNTCLKGFDNSLITKITSVDQRGFPQYKRPLLLPRLSLFVFHSWYFASFIDLIKWISCSFLVVL